MYIGQDLPIQPVLQLGIREKGQQEVTTTLFQVLFEKSIEFYQNYDSHLPQTAAVLLALEC